WRMDHGPSTERSERGADSFDDGGGLFGRTEVPADRPLVAIVGVREQQSVMPLQFRRQVRNLTRKNRHSRRNCDQWGHRARWLPRAETRFAVKASRRDE